MAPRNYAVLLIDIELNVWCVSQRFEQPTCTHLLSPNTHLTQPSTPSPRHGHVDTDRHQPAQILRWVRRIYGDQFLDELEGFGPGYGQGFGMGMMPFQGQQTLAQPKLAV